MTRSSFGGLVKESGRAHTLAGAWRALIAGAAFSLLWALVCNLAIEVLQLGLTGPRSVFVFTLDRYFAQFVVGSLVVWCLLMVLYALTGRLWLSSAVLMAASIGVGFANTEKLRLRHEPLYPSDLDFIGNAGFLEHMVGWRTLAAVVAFIGLAVLTVLVAGRLANRAFVQVTRKSFPRLWVGLVTARTLLAVCAVLVLAQALHFNSPGNKLRAAYEASGTQWKFWYQTLNYQTNGFVGGVLYNLNVPAMVKPGGYSADTMADLSAKYARIADRLNQHRVPSALDDVNVVAVLSEAFSDPSRLAGVQVAHDPIPQTRRLMRSTDSGAMLAQLFGGGTANMEFETLTGMSLSQFEPQLNTPYQMLMPRFDHFPSVVGYLRDHGHDPIAIHPYMTSMYKREQVYPILGFDRFIHDTTMHTARKIDKSDFISDDSAFKEVTYQIARSRKPLFVNLVTMQNHYPMEDLYSDPIPVEGVKGEAEKEASGYARGLAYTDQALHDFIQRLKQSDEKTIVLFYGDHLPAFWPEDVYNRNGDRRMKETPFFVWSNFASTPHRDQPTTSPIYFMNKVFDLANAPLPPYYALLEELHREIPAMEHGLYIGPDNKRLSLRQLSPRARQLLHDYRLVQYDLSVGQRYSQANMFYPPDDTAVSASGPSQ